MQVSHRFATESAVFDEAHLVSCAGLVPVMALAGQTELRRLLGEKVHIAEVAEIQYAAFASNPDRVTARPVVRRVKDARFPDALFPVRRYHPFFTNTDLPVEAADITHRQHAIIETVFADLIDGPGAHPLGPFRREVRLGAVRRDAHNLLRAAGVLAGERHTRARGSTLRRRIVNAAARLARPQHRPILHLPTHWPWSRHWLALWRNIIGYGPPPTIA